LSQEARYAFGSIKNAAAQGSKIYQLYKKASNDLQCTKIRVRNAAFKQFRDQFFDTVETDDVNEQLDLSLLDLKETEWTPPKVDHCLDERRHVVNLLSQQSTQQASLEERIQTITAIVALCQVQEALYPQKRIHDRTWGINISLSS
jgi:hypothetical protein